MTTSNLLVDDGILYDDYRLQSTNFNPDINYDPNIRKNNDPFYIFRYTITINTQNYYLRNQKINEIVGNLGGLTNAIFLIGKLICMTYNSIYLRFKIISTTFAFSSSKKDNSRILPKDVRYSRINTRSAIVSKIAKQFSFCSYLFPSKEVRMFYQNGSKHLYEYMDIRRIIKRLQDLDKLKTILLTEDQRKLFECIPKPEVPDSNNKFSLDTPNEFKKKGKINNMANGLTKTMKSTAEINDPVNQRIISCLDAKFKEQHETFRNLLFFYFI